MRTKPEMVIGGGVPSWTKSIPGPKYMYDTDCSLALLGWISIEFYRYLGYDLSVTIKNDQRHGRY
jgi:hypothetical protein